MRAGPRGISRGQRLARSLCGCVPSSRPNNSAGPNRSRGIFPPPPPPKPVACSAEMLRPAGTGPHGDASPPECGSGIVLVQTHVALLSFELGLNAPPGASHVCQGLQRGSLQSVGQVVAGFAAVQVTAVDGRLAFDGPAPVGSGDNDGCGPAPPCSQTANRSKRENA